MRNLVSWVQTSDEPLCSYATGLLASAMEIQDIAATFKDNNAILVRTVLHVLQLAYIFLT